MHTIFNIKSIIKNSNNLSCIALFYILLAHISYIFIFPPVYGWWQAWVYVTNGSYSEAVRAGYLFPPLYFKYYSLFADYLKYPILSLALGVIRTIFIYFVLYTYLKYYYSKFVSSLTSFIFIFSIISTGIYLPDDYHTLVTLFVILSLIFFDLYINSNRTNNFSYLFLCSLFSVLTMLTKQNIGLLLILGITSSLILNAKKIFPILTAGLFIFFCFTNIGFSTYYLDFNLIDLFNISFRNDAKGDKISLLTNLITNKHNFRQLSIGLVLNLSAFYFINYILNDDTRSLFSNYLKKITESKLSQIYIMLVVFFSIYILFNITKNQKDIVIYIAMFTIGFYISCFFFSINFKGVHLLFPFLSLVIANSFTSGLSQDDMIILCIPAIIFIIVNLESILILKKNGHFIIYFLIVSLIGINVISTKINFPWSWFGADQSAISYSSFTPPYKELMGLKTDEKTYKLMNSIKLNIETYSRNVDDTLIYPNIPFFYILHSKIPPFVTPVYWFDTATDKKIDYLISNLNIKKPELIIFFDPPNFAYQEHSKMKKHEVSQTQFNRFIENSVKNGIYKLIDYQIFRNDVGKDNEIYDSKFILINPELIGMTYQNIRQKLNDDNIYFEKFEIHGLSENDNNKIKFNDVITINIKNSDFGKVAGLFGATPKYSDEFYSLKVYKLIH